MKINHTNKTLYTAGLLVLSVLVGAQVTNAIGSLTPSGTAGDDTQYTLNDIYTKLTTGSGATIGSGAMVVPGSPSASFRTLTEIYDAIPEWVTLSDSSTLVSEGYYEETDLTTIDPDLAAENITDGTEIFGVMGTNGATGSNLDWSTNRGANTWSGAVSVCSALVEGGHSDWYLPEITDFAAITDFTETDSATDEPGFLSSTQYWSNTHLASDSDYSWFWSSYGGELANDVLGNTYETRCVRNPFIIQ